MVRHALQQLEALGRCLLPDEIGHGGVVDRVLEVVGQESCRGGQPHSHIDGQRLGRVPFLRVDTDQRLDEETLQEDVGRGFRHERNDDASGTVNVHPLQGRGRPCAMIPGRMPAANGL